MTTNLTSRIEALLDPQAALHGFELVAVEQAGTRHAPVIRVLLDKPEGINLDALAEANRWVSEALEEHDPIAGPYTLEVSSPGIDRPLRKIADFERFIGQQAHVRTTPLDGRSSFTGTIVGVSGETVRLEVEGETFEIALSAITKANLKAAVDFTPKEREEEAR